MKVLTIKQPFASLIAEGYKEFEFRTWSTKYRGEILIHAGKSVDKEAMKRYEYLNLDYPTGCIIARAKICDCVVVDDSFRKFLNQKNQVVYYGVLRHPDWKGYGFQLKDIQKIVPVSVNGKLGFWTLPEDMEELIFSIS